jgi:hypothetical protein
MPSGAAHHPSGLATHGKDAASVRPRVAMECSAWRGQQATLHVQSVSRWAPSNIGPYSQAKTLAGIVLVSGQIALDPASMLLLGTSAEQQAAQCLRNLEVVAPTSPAPHMHVLQAEAESAHMAPHMGADSTGRRSKWRMLGARAHSDRTRPDYLHLHHHAS